jgi:hypothetical protein
MLGQVEDQQRPHAVIGEALPHLGEEQHEQAARVARMVLPSSAAYGLVATGSLPNSGPLLTGGRVSCGKLAPKTRMPSALLLGP